MPRTFEPPPLAHYKPRGEYDPKTGDYIVWAGWFTTWHGLVTGYDRATNELLCIFAGIPYLLLTMDPADFERETRRISLSSVKNSANGKYAILQQTEAKQAVWYI